MLDLPGHSVENKNNASIYHVPFIPCEVVEDIRNEVPILQSQAFEHGALPKATTTKECSEGVHDAKREDAFNWPRDDSEGQSVGVVFIPSLDVERQRSCHCQNGVLRSDSASARDSTYKQIVSELSSSPAQGSS
jgi:hypothetical protein